MHRGCRLRAACILHLLTIVFIAPPFAAADRDGATAELLGEEPTEEPDEQLEESDPLPAADLADESAPNVKQPPHETDLVKAAPKNLSTEASATGTCDPALPVYHLIFKDGISEFIRNGAPSSTSTPVSDLTSLRSCQRWSTQDSCCTDKFFEQVGKIWDEEAKRFQAVRDYYKFVIVDGIQPAVAALDAKSQAEVAKELTKVIESLKKHSTSQTINEYIDTCEDRIRLFFGATICEVCDPTVETKLKDERVLSVGSDGCTLLHASCKDMPTRLADSAKQFGDAATQIKRAAAGLPQDGDNGQNEVHHAVGVLKKTSAAIASVATAIQFYQDRDKLCNLVEKEGYSYRRAVWGNIDTLHPGSQEKQKRAPERQSEAAGDSAMQAFQDRLKIVEDGAMGVSNIPLPPHKYGVPPPTNCVHGSLKTVVEGSQAECVCLPCWTGNRCEIPLENRAVMKQRFRSLTSDPQAQPQSIMIMGCNMFDATRPLQSLMTHIKFVPSGPLTEPEKKSLDESGLTSKDVCLVRSSDPRYTSLLTQVPISTLERQVEFLVTVPAWDDDTPQRYTVCFCFGPECLEELAELTGAVISHQFKEKDALSWYTAGHINVLDPHPEHGPSVDMAIRERMMGEGGGHGQQYNQWWKGHLRIQRPCPEQWAFGDLNNNGISAHKLQGDMVTFGCLKNFQDMQGPKWLRCIEGMWFEAPEEDGLDSDGLKAWSQHLPYCRWSFTACKPPSLEMSGGSVSVNAGMARYACTEPSKHLAIKGKAVAAASFVRWCDKEGDWTPEEVPTCEASKPDEISHVPTNLKNMTSAVPASLIELGAEVHQAKQRDAEKIASASTQRPVENASLPIGLSFIELSSQSHQTLRSKSHAKARSKSHTARDGVETSRRAKASIEDWSDGMPAETRARASPQERQQRSSSEAVPAVLSIHTWHIKFTNDNSHYFRVDTCWLTWDCTSGHIPDDAAASPFYAYSPGLREGHFPWLLMTAGAASLVVPVAMMSFLLKGAKPEPVVDKSKAASLQRAMEEMASPVLLKDSKPELAALSPKAESFKLPMEEMAERSS